MGPRQTTTYNLRIILTNSAPISVACLPLDVTNRLGVLVCSIVEEKRKVYIFIDFKVFCVFYNPNIISFFR
jgi:hypothetical protein